ncbi:hypothetical protein BUALT_Bualt05G0150300 [Buddleja alternifolia]|uniref:RING-type E3 ubiquitin transferase n=1 Tax=Buddleja alternifolia TaxID=168488 RepID=A0AAV6XJD2_9LAMI|nr:hypothetical protein BUALT_Bualt05G0150300 [Buddleja alternifolia]
MGLSDFISNEPRLTLEEVLKDWPVNVSSRRNFVDYVMTRVKEKYIRMPCRHNSIFLEFQVTAIQRHRVDERRVVEKEDDDYRTCSICLEEFSVNNGDCEGMPCSHIFHGDCIKKWLSTSHSCPVCRFEDAYE